MKRKLKLGMGLILAMSVMLTACGSNTDKAGQEAASKTAEEMQDTQGADNSQADAEPISVFGQFKAETIDGDEVNEEIFSEKKLTMVNIWGTFCGPCIREMPDLGELNREYADKGFQIVGIISDVNKASDETALEVIEATKADYTHIVASEDIQRGILSQIQLVPTTIFVDENGMQVGGAYFGAKEKDDWAAIIDELLGEVE